MLDLASVRFQATTLRLEQLVSYYLYFKNLVESTPLSDLRLYYEARRDIYKAEYIKRLLGLRAIIDIWRNAMLITRTDEGLFQYAPSKFEDVKPLIMDLLWSGEHVWWHNGTEQWGEFEAAIVDSQLVWNDEHTAYLVNIVLYTLEDGVTTSEVVGTFWRFL